LLVLDSHCGFGASSSVNYLTIIYAPLLVAI
jgi:hypothetical protein